MTMLAILIIFLLISSDIPRIETVIVILIGILSVSLIFLGLIKLGEACDYLRIAERQKNTGKVATADDIRKAYYADWIEFVVKEIELITDDKRHPKARLAEISIRNAYAANGHPIIFDEGEKNKSIRTPQDLEVGIIYIVGNDGIAKPIN